MPLNIPSLESESVQPAREFGIPDDQLSPTQRKIQRIIHSMLAIRPAEPMPAEDSTDTAAEEEPALAA